MNRQIKIIISATFLTMGLTASADSGVVPGLGEAMMLIGVAVSITFILIAYLISILTRWILNSITKERRSKLGVIYLGVLAFSSTIFFAHGISDLSFSSIHIILIIIGGVGGGIIGFFMTKKEKTPNKT